MAKGCLNRVTLVGNLGSDPDLRFTPRRTAVSTCNLATTESWVDHTGKVCERAEWHKLVMWRSLAEMAKQHLRKGSRVYVEGKLNTRVWHDARGGRNSVTEIVVKSLKLLGPNQAHLDEPIGEAPPSTQTSTPNTLLELSFEPSL
jgi:single-strand DNA-binding protein